MSGHIKLIIGCMYASKSSSMIHDIDRYRLAGRNCVIIKHSLDTRYDHLTTADRLSIITNDLHERNDIKILISDKLTSVDAMVYDVIGISEAQFFDDLLIIDDWATNGKIVIAEGLSGNFLREPFGRILELIPKCEKVKLLSAVCSICGADASFSKKTTGDMTMIHDVGGKDKYVPTCRKCYYM